MSEISEWEQAVEYEKFLSTARENVELMKARFDDVALSDGEEEILYSVQNEIIILVIGTDRCNDTAGILPVLARMASLSSKIKLRILDSDANAKFHQNYRVNGKRKTPVVLFLNSNLQEVIKELSVDPRNGRLVRYLNAELAHIMYSEGFTPTIYRIDGSKIPKSGL